MLSTDQINDLHRLYWSEHWPIRKIERHLRMSGRTIKKYLDAPAQGVAQRKRESKLDPFKATIAEWLEKDPSATAAVIEQRLQALGYKRRQNILREDGNAARRALRGRLGTLRRTRLFRGQAQALHFRPGRSAQPHVVSGVHP